MSESTWNRVREIYDEAVEMDLADRTAFLERACADRPALRDEVVARVDALDLPSYSGFVQPHLEAVRDADGTITDVLISYPLDLATQMLGYSGREGAENH